MTDVEIQFDVPAAMRDGVVLRADVYRPSSGGPWPVLLHRTPYGKRAPFNASLLDTLAAVSHGYMVVVQDTRGRFASDGEWEPWAGERADGYDTVRWAAGLPGCSGVVGMFGSSYNGNTQWNAAIAGPPELRAIAPLVTWSDPEDGLLFRGGATELGINASWSLQTGMDHVQKTLAGRPDELAAAMRSLIADYDGLAGRTYWELPAGRLPAIGRNRVPGLGVDRALDRPEVMDACRVAGRHERIDLPTFNVGGWYDLFVQGTLDNYRAMRDAGTPARLLVGPWTHRLIDNPNLGQVGDLSFGVASSTQLVDAGSSITGLQLRWFDHWLRGLDTGLTDEPPVKIFVMGVDRWREEDDWPLARAVDTPLHLGAAGALTWAPPGAGEPPDTYVYDPADPVITRGGALETGDVFPAGPFDQRDVEGRDDVLVYTSEPLRADLEVTGRVRMTLHAATDAPSTDWVVRLCDVDRAGVSRNVVDGVLRVAGTRSRVARHEIDLWSTSIVFRAGHRLRVQVTSSNFPRWDRNLGTGEPGDGAAAMRVARQTVCHDAARPSHLVLPVVPG